MMIIDVFKILIFLDLIQISDKITKLLPSPHDDATKESEYKEDCNKITKAIAPLEHIQVI